MLCCSSVFWMCVHTVPVVPFKPKGSNILWMCYSFLLLIMFKLYPQTKNAIKVCTKHERVPSLDPVPETFWIPCLLYTGQNFIFQGQNNIPHKMWLIKIDPTKRKLWNVKQFSFSPYSHMIQVTAAPVVI